MFIGKGRKAINLAKAKLKNSGVIICPAFTIYGFSAFLFDIKANLKIYRIKRRETKKPFIVIASKDYIKKCIADADLDIVDFLLDNAITVVVKTKIEMPSYASSNGKTAFRVANTDILNEFVEISPITSTSINISGSKEINSVPKMIKMFSSVVDGIIVDSVIGLPSTVIEINKKSVKVLREGFNIEKIREVIDD
ncbi:Sua5/YciO/YrdC/YwlC family protein [Hippea alviniae]|uniref:Sua5/YciO/YrdC/YwlC family protein n=1 Tax=Hippea alviniae TaxID=1279027 RepID=UPI0003B751FB|nr:Sua5/YciO/YrdC/YwlC family protein [Hippea alviniae]